MSTGWTSSEVMHDWIYIGWRLVCGSGYNYWRWASFRTAGAMSSYTIQPELIISLSRAMACLVHH